MKNYDFFSINFKWAFVRSNFKSNFWKRTCMLEITKVRSNQRRNKTWTYGLTVIKRDQIKFITLYFKNKNNSIIISNMHSVMNNMQNALMDLIIFLLIYSYVDQWSVWDIILPHMGIICVFILFFINFPFCMFISVGVIKLLAK